MGRFSSESSPRLTVSREISTPRVTFVMVRDSTLCDRMVSRKPLPGSQASFSQRLPSPMSHESPPNTAMQKPLSFENKPQVLTVNGTRGSDMPADSSESTDAWASVGTPPPVEKDAIPNALRGGAIAPITSHAGESSLPPSLQIGSAEITPRSSWESEKAPNPEANAAAMAEKLRNPMGSSPPAHSKNPFRQAHEPVPGVAAPGMSQYSEESNANPWSTEPRTTSAAALRNDLDDDNEIWNKLPPSPPKKPASLAQPSTQPETPADQHVNTVSNDDWHKHAALLGATPIPNYMQSANNYVRLSEQGVQSPQGSEKRAAQAPEVDPGQPEKEVLQDPNSYFYGQEQSQTSPYYGSPGPSVLPQQLIEARAPSYGTPGPSVPTQQLLETPPFPPPQPPRPVKTTSPTHEDSGQAASASQGRSDKASETYQIRLINWFDASSPTNPHRSPIMVQNANGPCPLLALVNALVLSTPSTLATPLVETLRVREQVSLGLLLDAVIDELMSGRRGDATQNLPDVSDLYAFLVNLHTGMNVNPRFVPIEEAINLMDAPIDAPSRAHDFRKPGGFEVTREMKLYSTFAIPLIHGWIPPASHPAFASLKRVAQTYEDAQNIMFREEELEDKLKIQGLSQEEQVTLEDIASIKYFLSSTATQLTGYGLDTVTETLAPGSLAILFRNDHFSTLYRHPRSGQLLTLVTDMGYAGHDEVVWESLVDVSGEGSEFYSGDFRPVGNIPQEPQRTNGETNIADEDGWETVPSRSSRPLQNNISNSGSQLPQLDTLNIDNDQTPLSVNVEQEDHDLALAMQLQEEEEDRERREAAARRREDELSQAYLNNADASGRRTFPGFGRGATGGGPSVPPRGGSATYQAPAGRPPIRRKNSSSEDAPPPSYEQAAKGPAYHPPANDPAYSPVPSGSVPRPLPQRPRGSSAYSEHTAVYGGSPSTHGPPNRGRSSRGHGLNSVDSPTIGRKRTSEMPSGPDDERKEKDCVVM